MSTATVHESALIAADGVAHRPATNPPTTTATDAPPATLRRTGDHLDNERTAHLPLAVTECGRAIRQLPDDTTPTAHCAECYPTHWVRQQLAAARNHLPQPTTERKRPRYR